MTKAPLLRVKNINKSFGGVCALDNVSIDIEAGEVHAIIGENGAGKSTLGKIIAGVHKADAGQISLDANPVAFSGPMDAQKAGVSIIFQELDLFPNLSIAENIAIGNLHIEQGSVVNFKDLESQCLPFLKQVELDTPCDTLLGTIPMGHMQLTAIARALSMRARLIIMDEPTSSLMDEAVENLFTLVRKLRDSGVSIIYVSHKMEEIFKIADRITVLRDGQKIGTRRVKETNIDEMIQMMVGRPISATNRVANFRKDQAILSVKNLTTKKLQDVSFDLYCGEVLGISGLVGAGRSELGAALFGLDHIISGTVEKDGEEVDLSCPAKALKAGIGLLPEDRKTEGLMMQMSIKENSSLSILSRISSAGFIQQKKETEVVAAVHSRTAVKAASPNVAVSTLSGGNQQKVLLSRWLLVDPDVIFLDDPTRGIDIGAKYDIYEIINELGQSGKGVIFVSSEMPELLQCCDRIMVMDEGRNRGILEVKDASQERIMKLIMKKGE
jgi:ribose transport system ATP-binding protein